MENKYRSIVEDIHTPAGLNERVLLAARRQTAAQAEPERPAKRRARPILRAAVCAACALALAAGTVRFYPAERTEAAAGGETGAEAMAPVLSFGLAAYAAETGELRAAGMDGSLALESGSGAASGKIGHFTGCLFRVTGEGIRTISLSVDRGGLYRSRTLTDLDTEDVRRLFREEELGEAVYSVYGEDENGPMNAEELTALGAAVTEDYDPEASYGFWVPQELYQMEDAQGDLRQSSWDSIDTFDGAVLTVTVAFEGGAEQTQRYRLSTGRLRVEYDEDGKLHLLPEWAEGEDLCVYGVLAEPVAAGEA